MSAKRDEEELDKDFELLANMTWDDTHLESSFHDSDDDEEDTLKNHEDEMNGNGDDREEEIKVLNQLIQEIKELTPLEETSELKVTQDDRDVSLVSRSKDAKIEISWEMMRNWDQNCEASSQNESLDR
jgi:hypothetical protein